jgi:hypothetical protein
VAWRSVACADWRARGRKGGRGRRCGDKKGGDRGRGPQVLELAMCAGKGTAACRSRRGSQVDAAVGDCRDTGDEEGVGEGLVEGGLDLREMAWRVKRDQVHEGMHCDGGSSQVSNTKQGRVGMINILSV